MPTPASRATSSVDADGNRDGAAARASDGLRQAVGALLQQAQRAGSVRDDVRLPEVYALLVGISRATARAHLDEAARGRLLAVVSDGLAPRAHSAAPQN